MSKQLSKATFFNEPNPLKSLIFLILLQHLIKFILQTSQHIRPFKHPKASNIYKKK